MTAPSSDRWIFHITHLRNLRSILAHGHLLCDSATGREGVLDTDIGMPSIKARRRATKVTCGAGGTPADYVPFYFGPRSPMLYSIWRGNVPTYGEGQDPVVYLATTVAAIRAARLRSVFTEGNAGAAFVQFHEDGPLLESSIDWPLMDERFWNDTPDDPGRANRRQAEYLVHHAVPVGVIRMLAARTDAWARQVRGIMGAGTLALPVSVRPD
ncbi:MAG: DUF4433 domain-containing protein [Dactylosporangium sp.]|nr:DUF4433 domain-containing protein [Dactylosporangium sp.]NNJ60773.1 DUF4433 domain-containing protein [Dactylosporangium sp.]